MTSMASLWPQTAVGRHARQWMNTVGPTATSPWRHVQAVDQPNQPLSFSGLPLDYFASGPGFLFTRDQWGAAATSVWLQGADLNGDVAGHQHADYGTLQIWRNGRYLTRETVAYEQDVAGYAGSGTANGGDSIGHNSLLVNGASAGPRYTSGEARVERLQSHPAFPYLAVNLAPPATAMAVWRREYVFVRALEALVVLDRLETSSAGATKTFLLRSESAPAVTGDDHATCSVGSNALDLTALVPPQRAIRSVDEGSEVYHQHRLEVDTTPGTASYILTVLRARDAANASAVPTLSEDGASWTVALDGSTRVRFEKGMSSVGGSITIAGSTTAFRADVQAMSVTDDGPLWAP